MITKIFHFSIFIIFSISFSGCSISNPSVAKNYSDTGVTYEQTFTTGDSNGRTLTCTEVMTDYKAVANKAVKQILKYQQVPKKVIVTEFVNLSSLENHTQLGFILSNNLKDALINNYQANVIEAEISKYFKLSGNGLKILSRNLNDIQSTNLEIEKAIVGTYAYTKNELIVYVKLANLKTGAIEGSYSVSLPMGPSTAMLLKKEDISSTHNKWWSCKENY